MCKPSSEVMTTITPSPPPPPPPPTTTRRTNDDDDTDDDEDDSIIMHIATTNGGGGFAKRKQWIEIGISLFSICYGSVYYWNPHIPFDSTLCRRGDDDTATTTTTCLRPDLIAYKATSLLAMTCMGMWGFYHWHVASLLSSSSSCSLGRYETPRRRLFGFYAPADVQNVMIFCYQGCDIVVSLMIPEKRNMLFLVHHVLAMVTAFCSLEYQMVSYYSIFYGGCSEISSVFLVFLDPHLDRIAIEPKPQWWNRWLLVCKGFFFVTFTAYRIVGWIYYSVPLWKDCQHVIHRSDELRYYRGADKAFVLRLFQGLDVALGLLQCYWYYQIVEKIIAMM